MLKKVGLSLMIVCLFVSIVGCKSKKDTLETHNISFVYEDGRVLNETIKDGESLKELTPPTKEGYEFVGWYVNDKEYDFNTKVTSDLKLTAKFKKIEEGNKYTVTFNSDGGTVIPNQIIEENKTIVKPIDPIKEGHEFIGWYLNNQVFDFNTKVTSNITLIAKYKKVEEKLNKYTVIFNSNGGSAISKQIIEENKTIVKPTNPTKKGYKFIGWYLNNKAYNFNTKVTSNITLIAKWEKVEVVPSKYTVIFNSNGGSAISKQIIEENKTIVKPINPTRTGYKFVGWYLNNKAYDFNTKVTSNITLTAKWNEIKETTTVKRITENVEIKYTNTKQNEVNMLRGTSKVTQNGVNGVKTITYNITYDSTGKEIKREKVSENITKQPINQITKVGISDYNLNSDTIIYGNNGVYCLDKDLVDVGTGTGMCVGNFEGYFNTITLKNITYLYSYSVGQGSSESAIYKNVKPLIKLSNNTKNTYVGNLNGNKYNFQFLMGGVQSPRLLTEADCNKYGFACGRW